MMCLSSSSRVPCVTVWLCVWCKLVLSWTLFVVFVLCMTATEQSSVEVSHCYGRDAGNTDYQEKKVAQKWKVRHGARGSGVYDLLVTCVQFTHVCTA